MPPSVIEAEIRLEGTGQRGLVYRYMLLQAHVCIQKHKGYNSHSGRILI